MDASPPEVVAARRGTRWFFLTRLAAVPLAVAGPVAVAAAMPFMVDWAPVLALTAVSTAAAAAWVMAALPAQLRRTELVLAWQKRDGERAVARVEGLAASGGGGDPLVDPILAATTDPEDRRVVADARARTRDLRADAAQARQALATLPDGPGRRELEAVAEAAEAEARAIDDQLAQLHAALVAPRPSDATEQLAARAEVERLARAANRARVAG
ncbi:MAG: hypothetical protein ABMB14_39055 [Myxococcota bacterium]